MHMCVWMAKCRCKAKAPSRFYDCNHYNLVFMLYAMCVFHLVANFESTPHSHVKYISMRISSLYCYCNLDGFDEPSQAERINQPTRERKSELVNMLSVLCKQKIIRTNYFYIQHLLSLIVSRTLLLKPYREKFPSFIFSLFLYLSIHAQNKYCHMKFMDWH